MAKFKVYQGSFSSTAVVPDDTPLETVAEHFKISALEAMSGPPEEWISDTGITFHSNSVEKS